MSDAAPQPGANSPPALQLLVSSRTAAADGASAELLWVPIGAASVAWQTPAGTTAAALVEYDWTEEGLTHARRAPDRQRVKIGVVAQRVQQQIPEMVLHQPEQAATETMGATPATWNIKPDEAVPYLIRAIQQQQDLIVALTARLETLEAATSAGGRNA